MQLLAVVEVACEKRLEQVQSKGVRLSHHGRGGHVVVYEPKDDGSYHGQHQEGYHACNVVAGARADGFVDKALA